MKRFDSYGVGLNLLFRGEDNYKTKAGGAISILVHLVVLVYAVQKVLQLVQYDDPDITTTEKIIRLNETKTVNLGDNHFDIMTYVYLKNKTRRESVKIPSNIGYFRMIAVGLDEKRKNFAKKIPSINCEQ